MAGWVCLLQPAVEQLGIWRNDESSVYKSR